MARKNASEKEIAVSVTGAAPARTKSATAKRAKHPAAPVVAEPTEVEPSREQIARLAYIYWADRGCQGGSPEDDWLRAEQELRASAATA
jgi:hypothetical protein